MLGDVSTKGVCPYCKEQVFDDDDYIVAGISKGLPYHKYCYNEIVNEFEGQLRYKTKLIKRLREIENG